MKRLVNTMSLNFITSESLVVMDDVNFQLIMLFAHRYLSVHAHKTSSQKIHNSSLESHGLTTLKFII